MKNRFGLLKLFIVLCISLGTTALFGQTTYTWTGANDGTNIGNANNWNPVGTPSGTTQDTAEWDGTPAGALHLDYFGNSLSNTWTGVGFGSSGVIFYINAAQTSPWNLTVVSNGASPYSSPYFGFFGITIDAGAGAVSFGDTSFNALSLACRPGNAGQIHNWINNSSFPATIYPNVAWVSGGGVTHVLDFGGTGNWNITNYLIFNNASTMEVEKDGTGTMYWAGGNVPLSAGNNAIISPFVITGGEVVLESINLLGSQLITNDGTLDYNAAGAATLSGPIHGTGELEVSAGTLTLSSGTSDFTGNVLLAGGTVIVNRAENPGISGPLGANNLITFSGGTLEWSVNNISGYSARFDPSAGQQYSFNPGGQAVTITNGLDSVGGSVALAGSGTLTLTGANGYTGTTTVNGGKLVLQGSVASTAGMSVADGATLAAVSGSQLSPSSITLGSVSGATLEFDNVSSLATPLIAAGALTSSGTLTVNVIMNAPGLTVGQVYPLMTWTGGTAPTVNLGSVTGGAGTLSTTGNTLALTITALPFTWTGLGNGDWDTTSVNNWVTGGSSAPFVNGAPAVFNDTATGTTNVTLNAAVTPSSTTVNNSALIYTITSSASGNISGTGSFTKIGAGLLTSSGGANTYTGVTTFGGGLMSISTFTNGGIASDIGASANTAASLVFNGGTLQYTGPAESIDRLFSLASGGGTIDNEGSGNLILNNAGSVGFTGPGSHGLTLAGASADTNTLAAVIADNGGATSVTLSGAANWIMSGNSTYSGGTTVGTGTLQIGTGGSSGTIGAGAIVNDGLVVGDSSATVTLGAISGGGTVIQNGTGTLVLSGDNTYGGGFGVTTINSGKLQYGSGGATGSLASGTIVDNGGLVFNTGEATTYAGISGTGTVEDKGTGVQLIQGINTWTGSTLIDSGATLEMGRGNSGSFTTSWITNNGTLQLIRQDNGVEIFPMNISGTGGLQRDNNNGQNGDVTLTGTNTYTGGTVMYGGALILGDNIDAGFGSIVGNVSMTNFSKQPGAGASSSQLTFNRPDTYTFAGAITGVGAVLQEGAGTTILTGANTYTNIPSAYGGTLIGTTITAGTLQVGAGGTSGAVGTGQIVDTANLVWDRSDVVTFANLISGIGNLVQLGTGTLILTDTNTYTGTTTISNGILDVTATNSAASTTVDGGTLGGTGPFAGAITTLPGSTIGAGAGGVVPRTLTADAGLSIGGNVSVLVNKALAQSNDVIAVTGTLVNTGSGNLTVQKIGGPALAVNDRFVVFNTPLTGTAMTVSGAGVNWVNNLANDGSISVGSFVSSPTISTALVNVSSNAYGLQLSWSGAFKLQGETNKSNVGLSNNWVNVPGGATSPITLTINKTNAAVFLRLVPTP